MFYTIIMWFYFILGCGFLTAIKMKCEEKGYNAESFDWGYFVAMAICWVFSVLAGMRIDG